MEIGKNWHLKLRLKIEQLQKELDLKTIRLRIAEKIALSKGDMLCAEPCTRLSTKITTVPAFPRADIIPFSFTRALTVC